MIEVTRLNGKTVIINAEMIETVEETPDTVVTLESGKKFIVKESGQVIKNLVISYKKEVFANKGSINMGKNVKSNEQTEEMEYNLEQDNRSKSVSEDLKKHNEQCSYD